MRVKKDHICTIEHRSDGVSYCLECNYTDLSRMCQHTMMIGNYCIGCHDWLQPIPSDKSESETECDGDPLIFCEDINIYNRDLVVYNNNNFNYLTNLLPDVWKQTARAACQKENYKFITRTCLRTLPIDISIKYLMPKIANSKGKQICVNCGRLMLPDKFKSHKCKR